MSGKCPALPSTGTEPASEDCRVPHEPDVESMAQLAWSIQTLYSDPLGRSRGRPSAYLKHLQQIKYGALTWANSWRARRDSNPRPSD